MKNFKNFTPEKYSQPDYKEIEEGIYQTEDKFLGGQCFVTSLSFEMEPECYGEEGASPINITQIPLEDLLEEFGVYVSDFYEKLNKESETICYQEFGSSSLSDIQNLRTIIGKRCYASPFIDESDGEEYYNLVIE